MTWKDDVVEKLKEYEGSVSHMYLDSVGLVTVGIGSLLQRAEDAQKLPFMVRDSGAPANAEQILHEWELLAAMQQNNYAASYFKRFTDLELSDEAIAQQTIDHLEHFYDGLVREVDGFDDFPEASKKAIMDMTFNLGLNGVVRKFPKFITAFRNKEWAICKEQCNRRGIATARNEYVKGLFGSLT